MPKNKANQLSTTSEIQTFQKQKINIYICNNKKQALLIHSQPTPKLAQITDVVSTCFKIPQSQQILFLNGQELRVSQSAVQLMLKDKQIIHVVDRRKITKQLTIRIRRLNKTKKQTFTISSSAIIHQFIQRNIRQEDPYNMFLVYTGRRLNRNHSFAEEFVENQSEVFCLHCLDDEVKGEKRLKYLNKIQQEIMDKQKCQQENVEKRGKVTLFKKEEKQEIQIKLGKINQIVDNKCESNDQQNEGKYQKIPNFKKKNKSQQIILGHQQSSFKQQGSNIQSNNSLLIDPNHQDYKDKQIHSAYLNDCSSISSILGEQHHIPEVNKTTMFQNAFIGGHSEVKSQPHKSQASSYILSEPQENLMTSNDDNSINYNFDVKAPECHPFKDETYFDQQKIMQVNQSKENYSECEQPQRFNTKQTDFFGNDILPDRVSNHKLNESVQAQLNEQKQRSINRGEQKIYIDDNQDSLGQEQQFQFINNNKKEQTIKPSFIPTFDEMIQKVQLNDSKHVQTPKFNQYNQYEEVVKYEKEDMIFQENQLDNAVIQEKDQDNQTKGEKSDSQAFSRMSSRVQQLYQQNQYYFNSNSKKSNTNRSSEQRQKSNKSENGYIFQNTYSEHSQPQNKFESKFKQNQYETMNLGYYRQQTKQQNSLSIDQFKVKQKILLYTCNQLSKSAGSGSDKQNSGPQITQNVPQVKQNIQFDYLGNNLSKSKSSEKSHRKSSQSSKKSFQKIELGKDEIGQSLQSMLHLDKKKFLTIQVKKNLKLKLSQTQNQKIQTSLNERMSKDDSINSINSPIIIKGIKQLIESAESLQRMDVKLSNLTSSHNKISQSQLASTFDKEYYNIGNFVYQCQFNGFSPLQYFIKYHSPHDLKLTQSYP